MKVAVRPFLYKHKRETKELVICCRIKERDASGTPSVLLLGVMASDSSSGAASWDDGTSGGANDPSVRRCVRLGGCDIGLINLNSEWCVALEWSSERNC